MSRPVTIQPERILHAAREVFLELGFAGSTAEIARRAQVSEGSLFKRYGSKEALFREAMSHAEGDWTESLPARAGTGEVREILVQLGLRMLSGYRETLPRLIVGVGARVGPFALPYAKELRAIAAYLEAEMRRGRLRAANPEIGARAFLSGIQGHALLELAQANEELAISELNFVRGLVELLLAGMNQRTVSRHSVTPGAEVTE